MNVEFSQISNLAKASGEPLRLEILRVLARDSYGVLELCDIFAHKQSGMSHHLKVLAEAGLVVTRREGNSVFYSRALPNVSSVLAPLQLQLYSTIDTVVLAEVVLSRIHQVQQERVSASQQFFIQQADKCQQQQDLIAAYPVYGNAVVDLMKKVVMPSHAVAIEVGPGAGELLPVLAESFSSVLALDSSSIMLAKAQQYCEQQNINTVDFVCDDTSHLSKRTITADCVVMNMVLHHTPSPADIFMDIASSLREGGTLIVTDLCRHDQDWAKTACGDIWLGFDPEELQRWARLAGLQQGHSNYLALRNGFQVQLQQFILKSSVDS